MAARTEFSRPRPRSTSLGDTVKPASMVGLHANPALSPRGGKPPAAPLIYAATYRCARYGMPFLHVLRHADVHIHRTQCSPGRGCPTPKSGIFRVLYCPTLTHTGSCRPRLSAVQYGRSCPSPPVVGVLGVVATVCYSQYLKNAVLHCPTSPHTKMPSCAAQHRHTLLSPYRRSSPVHWRSTSIAPICCHR